MAQPFLLLATESLLAEGVLGVIMSGIRRAGSGRYFARVSIWDSILKKQKYINIDLMTSLKSESKKRKEEVDSLEHNIKAGKKISFSWENQQGSIILEMTLVQAVDKWLDSLNVRDKTLESYHWSINHLYDYMDKGTPVASIKTQHVTDYRKYLIDVKGLSPNSVNIALGTLITLFIWLERHEYINKKPIIDKVKVDIPEVKYLAERDIADLRSANLSYENKHNNEGKYIRDWDHHLKAFDFYLSTGCRLSEPFLGDIRGSWLIIPANESKSHKARKIKLNNTQISILEEMREIVFSKKSRKDAIKHYSKTFKKACRIIGLREDIHFHSLRHSYGCIRRLQTNGNMILVRDEMGHRNLRTTERYSEIELDLLKEDFPEYSKSIKIGTLIHEINT